MTLKGIVEKFDFTVVEQDGLQVLFTFTKPTDQEAAYIKANKQAIIEEILKQKVEREAIEAERERQRLIDSGDAKLSLVYYGSYLRDAKIAYTIKMTEEERSGYADWCRSI